MSCIGAVKGVTQAFELAPGGSPRGNGASRDFGWVPRPRDPFSRPPLL